MSDLSVDALIAAASVEVPPIENDPGWQLLKPHAEHRRDTEESLAMDCYYGECDHEDDCPTPTIEVCRECTDAEPATELEGIYVLVRWDDAEKRGHVSPESGEAG